DDGIAFLGDQLFVNVDRAKVVDDGSNFAAIRFFQKAIDEGGLARTEESGDHHDRNRHALAPRRSGRPGRASSTSSPSAMTASPFTSTCFMPTAGRFISRKV